MGDVGRLTPIAVAKTTKRGRYADGNGLYLQVSVSGSKSWCFRYMRMGAPHTVGLGKVSTWSLKEARERARDLRKLLDQDVDPLEHRKKQKRLKRLEAAREITFMDAAERYIKSRRAGWRNHKHAAQWTSTLERYAYPVFGSLPVAAIDVPLVLSVLQPIWETKPETAGRLRGRIEAILDWATVCDYRTGENPARWKGRLDKTLLPRGKFSPPQHMASMPFAELPAFLVKLRGHNSISARALEFTILCASRTTETTGAQWPEIDLGAKLWTVPGERMKGGRPHVVPLTARAIAILKSVPRNDGNPFVFPGARRRRGLSNMAMLQMLRGMGLGAYTVHGMRATFKTWASEMTSFPNDVSEAALSHIAGGKVEQAYKRGTMLAKRTKLMEAWAGYCAQPARATGKLLRFGGRG